MRTVGAPGPHTGASAGRSVVGEPGERADLARQVLADAHRGQRLGRGRTAVRVLAIKAEAAGYFVRHVRVYALVDASAVFGSGYRAPDHKMAGSHRTEWAPSPFRAVVLGLR
jgi:hypothetical protein